MPQMTTFDTFPSVPRNVDEQNRKFLLAVRDALMSLNSTTTGMASTITTIQGQTGPEGSRGAEGAEGPPGADSDEFLLMGA